MTPETGNLFWIDVPVVNDNVYPTSSDRENELGDAVPDEITFSSSNNIEMIVIPAETTLIDPTDRGSSATAVNEVTAEFRLKGKETKVFR